MRGGVLFAAVALCGCSLPDGAQQASGPPRVDPARPQRRGRQAEAQRLMAKLGNARAECRRHSNMHVGVVIGPQ